MKSSWRTLLLASVLLIPVGAEASEQAGVSAAVRGDVKLSRQQVSAQKVASGEAILMQDSLKSAQQSGLQILLLDETVFTLGENSEIVIDEFVYDPQTAQGKLEAEVVKGAFRFVSGKMKKNSPEDVQLRLPSGTIGIRGTMVAGVADAQTKESLVALLGPGRNSNTGDEPGKLSVTNAGQTVTIERPNFATRIAGPDAAPSTPFQLSMAQVEGLSGALSAAPGRQKSRRSSGDDTSADPNSSNDADGSDDGSSGGSADGSGDSGAGSAKAAPPAGKAAPPPPVKFSASEQAGQDTAVGADFGDLIAPPDGNLGPSPEVPLPKPNENLEQVFEMATIQDLVSFPGNGTASFSAHNMQWDPGTAGKFDAHISVDFGLNSIQVDIDEVEIHHLGFTGPGNQLRYVGNPIPFGAGNNGKAAYDFQGLMEVCAPTCTLGGSTYFMNGDLALFNENGQIAQGAGVDIKVHNGAVITGPVEATGRGPVPRLPGNGP